jgi:nifR3 family TIM-barrel protein
MKKSFWETLKKPILSLAPMADVTDPPFRAIIAQYGKPDLMFTEFVSADGLMSAGRARILKNISYTKGEHPIALQIFGSKPKNIYECAKLAEELGFDGLDINMGCPDKAIEKQGAGASLIKNPSLAKEIIYHAQKGVSTIPVSIKTRLGYNEDALEAWLPELLEMDPAAITIHLRTRKEMSKVPARWERLARAVEIRDSSKKKTLILGNGDLVSLSDAEEKVKKAGADGAMLGRAIFGNPWLFNREISLEDIPLSERFRVLVEHTKLYEELMEGVKSFSVMKKHYKAYVEGFPGAKELRMKLMDAQNAKEVEEIIKAFMKETHRI